MGYPTKRAQLLTTCVYCSLRLTGMDGRRRSKPVADATTLRKREPFEEAVRGFMSTTSFGGDCDDSVPSGAGRWSGAGADEALFLRRAANWRAELIMAT
jgi:hypothetical protein